MSHPSGVVVYGPRGDMRREASSTCKSRRSALPRRRAPIGVGFVWALLAATLGCGTGEQHSAARSADAGVSFEVKVVRCPFFSDYFVFPTTLRPGVAADISVVVSDPDGTRLELEWSATSGRFSKDSTAETRYSCDDLGEQVLTLAATDTDDCRRELDLEVTCLEE